MCARSRTSRSTSATATTTTPRCGSAAGCGIKEICLPFDLALGPPHDPAAPDGDGRPLRVLEAAGILKSSPMTGGADPIVQFFEYAHLRPALQEVSRPFGLLAEELVATLPRNPERTVALRKLLE